MPQDPILDQPRDIYNNNIGDVSELEVLCAFRRLGFPARLWENQPFDLIVCVNGKFIRIQIKTGRYKKGSIHFRPTRRDGSSYKGLVDYIAIYCPDNCKIYMIPIDEITSVDKATLRVDTEGTKSKRLAQNYEIYEYMEKLKNEV